MQHSFLRVLSFKKGSSFKKAFLKIVSLCVNQVGRWIMPSPPVLTLMLLCQANYLNFKPQLLTHDCMIL